MKKDRKTGQGEGSLKSKVAMNICIRYTVMKRQWSGFTRWYEIHQICSTFQSLRRFRKSFAFIGQLCMPSLPSILPYYIALFKEIDPEQLGLSVQELGFAYVQCLNPYEITEGGTVILKIKRLEDLRRGKADKEEINRILLHKYFKE